MLCRQESRAELETAAVLAQLPSSEFAIRCDANQPPATLAIIVDVSGQTTPYLEEIKNNIYELVSLLPLNSDRLRVGLFLVHDQRSMPVDSRS